MSDPGKAVFLSYASQDAEAAKRICDALRSAGVEVWFDTDGGLEHGDEWDQKIRRQIKECVLFLPIISANTQAREEGYFRIEWELAAQRALGIASGVAFILPIVVDDTREPDALVPDRFRSVQWTRLRGGELTPEVKARFLKLWSHRTGVLKHVAGVADPGPASARPATSDLPKPGWKIYAGLAGAVFALAAGAGWWLLRPTSPATDLPPYVPNPPVSPAAQAAVSETRLLAGKAQALLDSLDSVRDDYKLAEELVAQAKAKDATDAEVWAAEAQVHQRYIQRGWDTSDARRESARVATQRALRLDPQSFEARFAQAGLLAYTGREGTEKERLLRELRQERPGDKRVLRELGSTIDRLGRKEEGIAFMDEAAALPGGDPLALYNKSMTYWFAGRTVEAETALQAALAQRPFTSALLIGGWYAMVLHGDLARARAIMERVTPAELLEDRGCYFSYFLEMLARNPDAALARLRAVPRDWINDNWSRGPKGRLAGDALHMAGRTEAAAVEWRAALKLVDARLAADPTNGNLQSNRIRLLAKLGEKLAAEQQFAVLLQMAGIDPAGPAPVPAWVTDICIELGRKADVMRQIALGLKRERHAVDYTAALLRLDPQFDALRDEPDFQKLIAEAEAVEKAASVAGRPPRDWPKDPELKQALQLINGITANSEDYSLAEDLAKTVLGRNPMDPEALTVMARVQVAYLYRGFDRSDERQLVARRYAERAAQLAPNDPEALAALGIFYFSRSADLARARDLLNQAIKLKPDDPLFHRFRDEAMFRDPKFPREEALASTERTAALFPRDALTHYQLARCYRDLDRLADMERALDRSIAISPIANAVMWKSRLALWVRGDPAEMKTLIDSVPARTQDLERVVFSRWTHAMAAGLPDEGLAAIRGITTTWFEDFDYIGPRQLLAAQLLELQGKRELARLQYEAAFAEVNKQKARAPGDAALPSLETWIYHGLGRMEEARFSHRVALEAVRRPYRYNTLNEWWFTPIPASLLLGEKETALQLIREAVAEVAPTGQSRGNLASLARAALRLRFQIDPRMAPFRDDPEIKALLAEPKVKP